MPETRRFALLLEYDGTRFAGSQLQPTLPTVQSVLEEAILRATQESSRVAFAGRTDAGVHALGQVASFVSSTHLSSDTLQMAINAWLPEDVCVRTASVVNDNFDPRRQAVRRHYRYVIENSPVRPAIDRGRVWHVVPPLDAPRMAMAAQGVLGIHDFKAFASALEDRTASTVRELMRFDVRREGTRVSCELTANAFLPHQVRRMVGALTQVRRGKQTPEWYVGLLDAPATSALPAAPSQGLYLVGVEYPKELFPEKRG